MLRNITTTGFTRVFSRLVTCANIDKYIACLLLGFGFQNCFGFNILPAPMDSADAIQYALNQNGILQLPAGVYSVGRTIVIPSGGKLMGAGKGRTVLKLAAGVNDDLIRTIDFENLEGTKNIANSPYNFSISDLTLDGNYLESKWSSSNNRINNAMGSCIKIYGKRFEIDVEVNNCAEHALYSEGQGPRNSEEVASIIRIFGTTFGKEAVIFRGPGDILIDYAVLGFIGILPKPGQTSKRSVSLRFKDSDNIDGIVIDKTPPFEGTVEIGFLHVYNAWNGVGFRTRGNPRVQARHLISEGNLGGVAISRGTWGGIGMLDIHNNGKSVPGFIDSAPTAKEGILIESAGPFYISGGVVNRTIGSGEGWPALRITGSNQIVNVSIKGAFNPATQRLYSGDAVLLEGSGNILNAALSRISGVAVSVTGSNNQVRAVIGEGGGDCKIRNSGNQVSISGGGGGC